jgi:hypothetical protein
MGTVGVLEQAAARGLVDLPEVLTRLLTTNFRILRTIINDALTRDAERKRRKGENQKQGEPQANSLLRRRRYPRARLPLKWSRPPAGSLAPPEAYAPRLASHSR